MGALRSHVALLGDSIFDNRAYVGRGPDVIAQLRGLLPRGWIATLCAVDGAVTSGLAAQLHRVPAEATHLVVSIGGNDALQNSDLLAAPAASSAEVLRVIADRVGAFERAYRAAIEAALHLGRDTTVCTVYNGALEPERAAIARIALALFNDAILRTALDLRLTAIDLRSVCDEPADYANAIEPSSRGGAKIAAAIACSLGAVAGCPAPASVWGSVRERSARG